MKVRPRTLSVALVLVSWLSAEAYADGCTYTTDIPKGKLVTIQIGRTPVRFKARFAGYIKFGDDSYLDLAGFNSHEGLTSDSISLNYDCGTLTFELSKLYSSLGTCLFMIYYRATTGRTYGRTYFSKSAIVVPTHVGHAYRCKSNQTINLKDASGHSIDLILSDVTMEFDPSDDTPGFDQPQDLCEKDLEMCPLVGNKPLPQTRRVTVRSDGGVCMIAELSAYVKIGKAQYLELIDDYHVDGSCPGQADEDNVGTFVVNYQCATLNFTVSRRDAQSPTEVVQIDAVVHVPQSKSYQKRMRGFKTKFANQSYNCETEQEIVLREGSEGIESVSVVLSRMMVEAFRIESSPLPYQRKDYCATDRRACPQLSTKPEPDIKQAKLVARRGEDAGSVCLIAEVSAYLQIGEDRYVALSHAQLGQADSMCPGHSGTGDDGILSLTSSCGNFDFHIYRDNDQSPVQITTVVADAGMHLPFDGATKRLDGFGARSVGHAYHCESERRVVLREASEGIESVSLVVRNMTVEAFRSGTQPHYYQPQDRCRADYQNYLCKSGPLAPVPMSRAVVRAGDGARVCAVANLKAYFRIGQDRYINLRNVVGGGECSESGTEAVIEFSSDCGSLTLHLYRQNGRSPLQVSAIVAEVYASDLNLKSNGSAAKNAYKVVRHIDGFDAKFADHAYHCQSEQTVTLREASEGVESLSLVLSSVRIEAFRDRVSPAYYQPEDRCRLDYDGIFCKPDSSKPVPRLNRAEVWTEDGAGICAAAHLTAYFQVGQNRYIELDRNVAEGKCQAAGTEAVIRFAFDCGSLTFYLRRQDVFSPLQVSAVVAQVYGLDLELYKKIDGWTTERVNDAYHCTSEQTLVLREGSDGVEPVSLIVSNVTIEAFGNATAVDLYQPRDITICPLDLRPELCAPSARKPPVTMNEVKLRSIVGKGVCLIAQLEAYLEIGDKYVRLDDGKGEGSCSGPDKSDTYASLQLNFACASLKFSLYRDDQLSPFRIASIRAQLDQPEFKCKFYMEDEFEAAEPDHSYHCEPEQRIVLREGSENIERISLVLSNVTIEAFRDESRPELYQQRDICAHREHDIHFVGAQDDDDVSPLGFKWLFGFAVVIVGSFFYCIKRGRGSRR